MLVSSLTLALACSISTPIEHELPYQELADRFITEYDLSGKTPEEVDLSLLLEQHFFSTRLGQFEVWIPGTALANKETARDYQAVCTALCVAQSHWIDWMGEEARDQKAVKAGFKALGKWVKGWKTSELGSAIQDGHSNALDLFKAKDKDRQLSAQLAKVMQSGSSIGTSMEVVSPVRLVLMPERKGFVEFLAFSGWLLPDQQPSFWIPGIQNWTEFRLNDLQVIALQYPATVQMEGDYEGSTSMKDRDVSGLEQQVVQLGINQLLAYQHGDALPTEVISGLSISMLIELYGTCHTRNDGDMRARHRAAREIFVSGGRSSGGRLPQNVAESRWRTDYGKNHYNRILKQVQKSGASSDKRNRHKYNSFLLIGDNESDRFVVHAPILGDGGLTEEVPQSVSGDYLEFLRAYNVAFLYWVQTEAGGSKKKSAQAFSRLLSQISHAGAEQSFAATIEGVYGMPLSNSKLDTKSLEGRFLKWISKQ